MTTTTAAIMADNLTKAYRGRTAVDGITLRIEPGEVFGVLGTNGAGKTTTVEMLAGLRKPDGGDVRIFGFDPRRDRGTVRQILGVQLQQAEMHHSLTVDELIDLYRSFYPDPRPAAELRALVGLEDQRRVRFEKLSGGQQQRLSIALALIGDPQVLILDELTTGLDPEARRQIWALVESVRAEGVTILLVSHQMEEVQRLSDQVAIIDAGRVVALGTSAELIARADLGERVRFRVPDPLPEGIFDDIPEAEVHVDGEQVSVSGAGDLLQQVSTALVHGGVAATETRLEQADLEDAFLALTGRPLENTENEAILEVAR